MRPFASVLRTSISTALVLLAAGTAAAQVPDTPAGRQFSAWLDAMNSSDSAAMQAFMDESMPGQPVAQGLAIRAQSGGYDVKKIETSSATNIVVLVQERGPAKQFARVLLNVTADAPDRIAGIGLQPAQPPPELAPAKLTAAEVEAARAGAPFRQLSAWLDAFNGGNREQLQQYLTGNYPSANIDQQMNFRAQTGGFEFRLLEQATATSAVGLVQERGGDQFARFVVTVEPDAPHKITRLGLNAIPRPAEFPALRVGEAELIAALRAKAEADAAADRFAGAVLLGRIVDGESKVLFSGAYGLADREAKIANTLDTRFRNGSMNKMFTAVSVLQLVQAGKIALTDPLGKSIADYPNQDIATKVTIHHLLTHQGGTGDIFGPQFAANRLNLREHDDYIGLYGQRAPLFEPGSRYAYSNYGMVVLGAVIERASGMSYYDYVAANVYRPAGMTRTASEPESETVEGRSVGYMRAPGVDGWARNTETLPYRGMAAGGGYTTVGDLLKFATALMQHKLLDEKHTALLLEGKVDIGPARKYAYGFEDARKDGRGAVGHSGGAPGMSGDLRIYPKSGYVVAALSNQGPVQAPAFSSFVDLRLTE
jgi:CubicO group peptidase (beta-lactamase class C family)